MGPEDEGAHRHYLYRLLRSSDLREANGERGWADDRQIQSHRVMRDLEPAKQAVLEYLKAKPGCKVHIEEYHEVEGLPVMARYDYDADTGQWSSRSLS